MTTNNDPVGKEQRRTEQLLAYAATIRDYKSQLWAIKKKLYTAETAMEAMAREIGELQQEIKRIHTEKRRRRDVKQLEEATDELRT